MKETTRAALIAALIFLAVFIIGVFVGALITQAFITARPVLVTCADISAFPTTIPIP